MSQRVEALFWIGGAPCSGKSSVSRQLAGQYQLDVYHCDNHFGRQLKAADPQTQPTLYRLNEMTWDQIFSRPAAVLLPEEVKIYRELFPTILEEVRRRASAGPLLVEGAALLPQQIDPLRSTAGQVVYLVPTPAFQRRTYAARAWRHKILAECRDPERALANWMGRDEAFARWVAAQAQSRGMGVLRVSGARTVEENAALVAAYFGLDGSQVPRGATVVVYRQGTNGLDFLLLHRSTNGPAYEGDWAWTAPSGARAPDEPIELCAARELEEETGLALELRRLRGKAEGWALFVAQAPVDARVRLSAEHDRFEWLALDRALERIKPSYVADAFQRATSAIPR